MHDSNKTVGLIVVADEPALFFSSISVAQNYLEAVDVDNGVYPIAFGRSGEVYDIFSDDGQVVIRRSLTATPQPEKLRSLLLTILKNRNIQFEEECNLERLVDYCSDFVDDW
jgi:hypothetical protein